MGGASGETDIGIHGGACALVDQGIIPKYLHGADGAGEAGGDVCRDMHGRGQGGVVIGSGNSDVTGAGEGGGEATRRGAAFVLEKGDGAYNQDEEDAKNDVLDKPALGLRGFKGGHAREQRAHTTPASLLIEGGVLLGRFLRERMINRNYKLSSSKTRKAHVAKGELCT